MDAQGRSSEPPHHTRKLQVPAALRGLPLSGAKATFRALSSVTHVVGDAVRAAWDKKPGVPHTRFVPSAPPRSSLDEESLDVWGFKDTRFEAKSDRTVVMSGDRYE